MKTLPNRRFDRKRCLSLRALIALVFTFSLCLLQGRALGAAGPDLVVTAIGPPDASLASGIRFTATLLNQGDLPTPAGKVHGVSFWINGMAVSWSDTFTGSLAPGESVIVSANAGWNPALQGLWQPPATGTYSLMAFADDSNLIRDEADEFNNTLTQTFEVTAAPAAAYDLVITDVDWELELSPVFVSGSYLLFNATLKNAGTIATPAGVVHGVLFQVDGAPIVTSVYLTASLAPGASVIVQGGPGALWLATAGAHTLTATADPANLLPNEASEANNSFSKPLNVPQAMGFDAAMIGAAPIADHPIVAGELISFVGMVKNLSTDPTTPPFTISVILTFEVDGVLVATTTVQRFLFGGTELSVRSNENLPASIWRATPGNHELKATVFVFDYDRNQANNSIIVPFQVDPLANASLPAPWAHNDIGAVSLAGDATFDSSAFTIAASSSATSDTADSFHFVYQPAMRGVTIIARVGALTSTSEGARAGVMIRESLDPDAKHALLVGSAQSGVVFQRRTESGGPSSRTKFFAPYWLKLTRNRNIFTSYVSPDGVTWTLVGIDSISMPDEVYVGLVVGGPGNGERAITEIRDVSVSVP